jgi:hypothetical protein
MERDYLIAAYFQGYAYFLTWGPSSSASVFGGPPPLTIPGIPGTILETEKLHYVGRIGSRDIPTLAQYVSEIPLFYGFTFDGCDLSYAFESSSTVSLMDLSPPRPESDYPYRDYPAVFPLIPLRLGRKQRMSYAAFSEAYPNMEDEDQPSDLIVAVPPAVSLGVSMWGKHGDAEDVTVMFECDLTDRTVKAYNRCT